MESIESVVAQVERFEGYCLKKRRLEGNIESVLVRIDKDATEAVEHAECELGNTKRECAEIEARVERARRGDFDRADKLHESGHHCSPYAMEEGKALQTSGGNTQLANNASNEPVQLQADIEPSPATSPPILDSIATSTVDSDDFSVVSDPQQEAHGPSSDKERIHDPTGHNEDNSRDEVLTLLVQRYTDICHERRTLQEEIENRLERKERMAMERLICAKIALETSRQKAVEIVAALNEASGGDTVVNLPAEILGSTDSKAISPAADGACASGSGPVVRPSGGHFVLVSGPVKVHEHATPTPPLEETPLPTSTMSFPGPDTIRPMMIGNLSQSTLRRIPAPEIPAASPLYASALLPSSQITTTQQAIFMKYDELMIAAKTATGSGLSMQRVPWPLFTPSIYQYPLQNIVTSHLVDSTVADFVQEYFRWKGWNLKVEGKSVLAEWEQLHQKVPDRKAGGKACMQRVVSILRGLVRS